MSGVGFFARLKNLWTGFLSLWIEGVEAEHPEAVYEAAIEERINKYNELKKAVSGIVYLRNKPEADLKRKQKELVEIEAQVNVAVDTGEDEVALVLLEKQASLSSEVTTIQAELHAAMEQAEEAKGSLISFQAEIEKLKREKEEMLAKRANAEARIKINSALDGLSTDADIKALDGVRESIHKLEAEADVAREVGASSLDQKLKKIKSQTANAQAKQRLEALKQARNNQQQQMASVQAEVKKDL